METIHKPVLLREVIEYLNPQHGQNFIDCTLGGGGHSRAILKKILPAGKLLAIDLDEEAIKNFQFSIFNFQLQRNIILVNDNFANLEKIVKKYKFYPVNGIIADFGFSSDQIADKKRGFSFLNDGPLNMKYNVKQKLNAEMIVNNYTREELEKIFKEYGEEPLSAKIANIIIKERKKNRIKTTTQLAEIIQKVKKRRGKIHPATQVFQAIRIETNNELQNIIEFLPQAIKILDKGGRLAIITFHSLEDRIVKKFFRKKAVNIHACRVLKRAEAENSASAQTQDLQIKIINKRVIKPRWDEVKKNKKARSAKLRVVEKV
ncbi:MAG: 16S rRNA (cytosine(1402)-N(4))-methyltransferase RsmH [Xanthomonadaceae bacterium]|nr:16S rRNA (cytosine(1402)-N(4))-methyltransferase RsmH [Rhodospirillaceae bacterium]NIA17664.1 16S rRNA (cytosine(1402)-N(4))-methyltransferase RsmH [Xanthomonadaceae bacterium]